MLLQRGGSRRVDRSSDRTLMGSLMHRGGPLRDSGWMFPRNGVPGEDWPEQ